MTDFSDGWLMKEIREIGQLGETKQYNLELLGMITLAASFENARRNGLSYDDFKKYIIDMALKKD